MKKDILKKLSDENNGYLFTAEVLSHKISKTYLSKFVKENGYERVAHGIYAAPDIWPDELYLLQKMNPKIIFSGGTALYIHGLTDREYSRIEVTVPQGYNAVHLRKKKIQVRSLKEDLYELGETVAESGYGNQIAMKEYMSDSGKRLQVLVRYAEKLKIRDEVMKYVEVLA